jgi:hypothetical protein
MNWRVGLLRLWVVGTALWILSVVVLAFLVSHAAIEAATLYPEYLYNHLKRHDVVAEARRVLSDPKVVEEVVGVPGHRLPCVSHWERERQEAHVAKLEAQEAKRPPPTGQLSSSQLERLVMPLECSAEIQEAQAVIASDDFPDWARDALLSSVYWLFGPPVVVLLIGASLAWAFRGFRAR